MALITSPEASRAYDASMAAEGDRQAQAAADAEARQDWIDTRAEQIAKDMVAQRTPRGLQALRYALGCREIDEQIFDLLHAMLWSPDASDTARLVGNIKARLLDLAALDGEVMGPALKIAEAEWTAEHTSYGEAA